MVSIPTGAHCRELASVTMCETAIPGSALELLPLSSLPYTTPAYSYILPCPKIKKVFRCCMFFKQIMPELKS